MRRGRKARGLFPQRAQPPKGVFRMALVALPELKPVPILSGSIFFLHSTAQVVRECGASLSGAVEDEKEEI